MQHVPVSQEILDKYRGAQITLENSDEGVSPRLARGPITNISVHEGEVRVSFTCAQFALGALDDRAVVTWHESGDRVAATYLVPAIVRADDGTLHFTERTGAGSIAIITPADVLDEAA